MVRHLSLALFLAVAARGQVRLHFGVEAGVPLTNAFSTTQITLNTMSGDGTPPFHEAYSSKTKRLLIGPTVRLDLPLGLGLQFDALYQRINYEETSVGGGPFSPSEYFSHYTADRWQFPLLLEYKLNVPIFKPFIDAGPSLSHVVNRHDARVFLNLVSPALGPPSISSKRDEVAFLLGITF